MHMCMLVKKETNLEEICKKKQSVVFFMCGAEIYFFADYVNRVWNKLHHQPLLFITLCC